MEVRAYTDSRNYTIIEAKVTESSVLQKLRVRVYNATQYCFDIYTEGKETLSFAIEDEGKKEYFITPYPNSTTGYVRLELEINFLNTGWVVDKDERYPLNYTINSNSVTKPTLAMSIAPTELSNGHNMVGTTALTPTFSASAKLGASVRSYIFTVEGKSYSTAPYTSAVLTQGGWQTVTGTVTDSRGFTTTVSERIWVMSNMPSLSLSGNTYLDKGINCNITPANKDAYSRLVFVRKNGDTYTDFKTVDVGQKVSNHTQKIMFEAMELTGIYNEYPDTTEVPLTVRLLTYTDAYHTKIEESSQNITLTIPENEDTKPQITSIVTEGHPILLSDASLFVKSKNGVKVTAQGTGKYNADIASIKWKIADSEYDNGEPSALFSTYGMIPVIAYVTDTRGFTNTKISNISVYDYTKPLLTAVEGKSNIIVEREKSQETNKDYLYIAVKRNYTKLNGYNKCVLRYRKKQYQKQWEDSYTELLGRTQSIDIYDEITHVELAPDSTYTIELSLIDDLGETDTYTIGVATEAVYMDRSGTRNSIAFGGHVTENNAFEVYNAAYFRGGIFLDDLSTGTRYRVKIANGNLVVTEEKNTFSLRR